MDSRSVSEMINRRSYQRIHRWLDLRNVCKESKCSTQHFPSTVRFRPVTTATETWEDPTPAWQGVSQMLCGKLEGSLRTKFPQI
jgi:hypothetical protein